MIEGRPNYVENIKVEWLDRDQRIMLWVFEGKWGWDQYYESVKLAHEMLREVAPDRTDIIALMVNSPGLPPNALSNIRQVSMKSPDNWKLTVVVGGGAFIKSMVSIGRRVNKNLGDKYAVADTLEAALAVIEQHRQPALTRKPV